MVWSAGAVEWQKGYSISCPLHPIELVGEERMLSKLTSIRNNTSHPLHVTVQALVSSFSNRLLLPQCRKERYRKSFLPAAIRLHNTTWAQSLITATYYFTCIIPCSYDVHIHLVYTILHLVHIFLHLFIYLVYIPSSQSSVTCNFLFYTIYWQFLMFKGVITDT